MCLGHRKSSVTSVAVVIIVVVVFKPAFVILPWVSPSFSTLAPFSLYINEGPRLCFLSQPCGDTSTSQTFIWKGRLLISGGLSAGILIGTTFLLIQRTKPRQKDFSTDYRKVSFLCLFIWRFTWHSILCKIPLFQPSCFSLIMLRRYK